VKRKLRALVAAVAIVPAIGLAVVSTSVPASAENNGVGAKPVLGWSSWSFVRKNPTAAVMDAQADAMVSSGLTKVGYQYVNLDDFWYQCPGSQGPNVDAYGRWVIDPTKFPSVGSKSGIQAVADHVHADGLKFGIYVTPGISAQAVAKNTPIEGTSYHAADIALPNFSEANYNCGGMVGIDYTKPGAQAFINSWAKQFASWGVDYLKIDGHPRRAGVVDRAARHRPADSPRTVQQSRHRQRRDLGAVLQRLADRRRRRMLLRGQRRQLPADQLRERGKPVRSGRRLAALRRAGWVQRLRLVGGRQRRQ
jgi:hypothetical protein